VAQVVRFEGADGSFMLVESLRATSGSDIGLASDDAGLAKAAVKLEDSLESVRGAAVALLSTVKDVKTQDSGMALDEVSLELGISLGVEGGVVVAKGSAKAETTVTLTWRAANAIP
jgi:hypothetical protein